MNKFWPPIDVMCKVICVFFEFALARTFAPEEIMGLGYRGELGHVFRLYELAEEWNGAQCLEGLGFRDMTMAEQGCMDLCCAFTGYGEAA